MSYASEVLADSPTGYWKVDETSGTSAADSAGANAGTYVNSPTLAAVGLAPGGTAVSFLRTSSQELTLPNNGLSTNGTIEFSFKWTAGTALMRDNTAAGGSGWIIGFDNAGTFAVRIAGGTTINTSLSTASLQDGNRHLLQVVKSGANVTVYVDGVSVGTSSTAGNTATASPWHIARNGSNSLSSTNCATCTIDDISIYSTALSSTRITAHYTAWFGIVNSDSGSGGFTLAGSDSEARVYPDTASGGFTLAGSDSEARVYPDTASGGFTLAGSASELYGQGDVVSGGFTLAGSDSEVAIYSDSGSGGFVLVGSTSDLRDLIDTGSGGFTLDGTGTDDWSVGVPPTATPLQGLDWHVTGLWYPGDTAIAYYGRIADPAEGEVRIPRNDSRTAGVTVSVHNPIVAKLLGHAYARCLRVYYHGQLVFWGPCKLNEPDLAAGTVRITAVDPSLRLIRHFVRRGDIGGAIAGVHQDRATVTIDHLGLRILRDCGLNTLDQTTRGVPDLGIADGDNDVTAAPDDLMTVARGDQVWEAMKVLSASLGPDFELDPVEDVPGVYAQLNTFASQGTDVSATVAFHYGIGKDNLENLAWSEGSKYTTHDQVLDRESTYRVTPANLATSAETGPYVDWDVTEYDARNIPASQARNVLSNYGNDVLAAYSHPLILATATLPIEQGSDYRYLRDFGVGDTIGLAGRSGYAELPDGAYRISTVTLHQENESNATRTELEVVASHTATTDQEDG